MTNEFTKPRFECSHYKNGKLYIFTRNKITVVKMTPHGPATWCKSKTKPYFKPCRLPIDLDVRWAMRDSAMPDNNDAQHPYCRFHINPQIKFFREKFDHSLLKKSLAFPSHNLDMYKMLMLDGAVELAESNPVLAYMVALNRIFCPKRVTRPWRRAKSMLKMKRRKILSMCGFPESESLVRIFSRIGRMTVKDIFFLRSALKRNPELLRTLSFVDSYSRMVFTFATLPSLSDTITSQFLNEVEQIDYSNTCKCESLMRDTLRMSSALGERLGKFRIMKDLQMRHDELIIPYTARMNLEMAKVSFPAPPVPALQQSSEFKIYPIDTPIKLFKEGCEQHNCVYTHRDVIEKMNGNTYIYTLIRPERATVKIKKFPGKGYAIDEIKGPCNRDVSPVTVDTVKRWLATFSETAMPIRIIREATNEVFK